MKVNIHVEKFSGMGIANLEAEQMRTTDRQMTYYKNNVDRKKTKHNIQTDLTDGAGWTAKINEWKFEHRQKTGKAVRKDAVWGIGVVCSVPEEWGAVSSNEFFVAAEQFLTEKFARQGVDASYRLGWSIHHDETSPHMQMVIAPVVDGQFCAKKVTTRAFLRSLQADYEKFCMNYISQHPVLAPLQPRTEGSKAKHEKSSIQAENDALRAQIEANTKALEELTAQIDDLSVKKDALRADIYDLEGIQNWKWSHHLLGTLCDMCIKKMPPSAQKFIDDRMDEICGRCPLFERAEWRYRNDIWDEDLTLDDFYESFYAVDAISNGFSL